MSCANVAAGPNPFIVIVNRHGDAVELLPAAVGHHDIVDAIRRRDEFNAAAAPHRAWRSSFGFPPWRAAT